MDVLKHHLDYFQDRMIAAQNKATEVWACIQSYMKSNNEVDGTYLSLAGRYANVIVGHGGPTQDEHLVGGAAQEAVQEHQQSPWGLVAVHVHH